MVWKNKIEANQLLEAIDFFAQNLSFEQITSYGYHFIHSMIGLVESGIYVLEDNMYQLKHNINGDFKVQSFVYDDRMRLLAAKFGRATKTELKTYFDADFIDDEGITFAFPILVKNKTHAIIFAKADNVDMSNPDVASAIHGINQMVNKATENAINYKEYKHANAELDKKIFNLLFINHSTKAFMSQLDINKLYELCIDVISEITASSVTSFALYEPSQSKIILRGYKDISTYQNYYNEFETLELDYKINQVIYNINEDYDKLSRIFKTPEKFKALKAEYVILIVKKEVIGFVTIGKSVSGGHYSKELLNQIESLSASIYIAISNAQYVQKINSQNDKITSQLKTLEAINKTTKIMNSCESVEELVHITLRTINLSFDFDKALIAFQNEHKLIAVNTLGIEYSGEICFSQAFDDYKSDLHFDSLANSGHQFINQSLSQAIGEHNCFVSIPLIADNNEETLPMGYILAFQSKTPLKKRQIIALDTITNSIAPILKQLMDKEEMQKQLIVNEEYEFFKKLHEAIMNRDEYYLDFVVYFKKLSLLPFESFDPIPFGNLKVFVIRNLLFHIGTLDVDESLFDGYLTVFDQNSFIEEIRHIV